MCCVVYTGRVKLCTLFWVYQKKATILNWRPGWGYKNHVVFFAFDEYNDTRVILDHINDRTLSMAWVW